MATSTQQADDFYVRFWGVRGSIPCGGPEVQKYGGNTSCLEIRCGTKLLIFDGGSGIRYLGNELAKQGKVEADIFLTHGHMDHVCGLPFFKPLYQSENCFRFHSAMESCCGKTTKSALSDLMTAPLLPVDVEIFNADVSFFDFACGADVPFDGGIVVKTTQLNHPNGASGYRVDYQGKSICYITDTEHREGGLDQAIIDLVQGADVFIYDAMYTDEEYPKFKGFGHSTWQEGARLADAANVKIYAPFHHDPDHDDDFMDALAVDIEARRPGSQIAREGLVLRP